MRVLKVFFLGLLYGWFMKWVMDEIFTKDHLRMITNENSLLKERIRSLEMPRPMEARLQASPTPQPDQRPAPVAVAPVKTSRPVSRRDDLKKIKGVGPQMEKKLNNAGVFTFEQMSRLTTKDIQNILGISKRVVQSADNLINQARNLAQPKSKK